MRTLTLKRMVRRLEGLSGGAGPCPYCAGRPHVVIRGDQPVPLYDVCGMAVPTVRIVRDPDFYGNIERLRQCGALDEGE
jgi:hypothetical protein